MLKWLLEHLGFARAKRVVRCSTCRGSGRFTMVGECPKCLGAGSAKEWRWVWLGFGPR